MKFKELKILGNVELKDKLTELKKELIKLNAQAATGTAVKSPGQIKQTKKGIARILTLMNQRKGETEKVEPKIEKPTEVVKKA